MDNCLGEKLWLSIKIYELKALIILALLASLLIVSMPQIANANIWPSAGSMALINAYCPAGFGQYEELNRLKKEMTAARTLNHACNMALAPTDEVIQALNIARTVMPFSDNLRTAETCLSDARHTYSRHFPKRKLSMNFPA